MERSETSQSEVIERSVVAVTDLCKKTYCETKELHKLVDNHKLVKEIHLPENTKIYIDLVEMVLFILEMNFFQLEKSDIFAKLRRNPPITSVIFSDIIKKIMNDMDNVVLYKSQIYLWYLSLMAGGRILKKVLPEKYNYLFTFDIKKEDLKSYINQIPEEQHVEFIENVKITYKLIEEHFSFSMEKELNKN
jgi:hypothetical protein